MRLSDYAEDAAIDLNIACNEASQYFAWMLERVALADRHYRHLRSLLEGLKALADDAIEYPDVHGRSLELINQIEIYLTMAGKA